MLAREFDAHLKEVRAQTLSLARMEAKLDHCFHEVHRVALSMEEIKSVLAEGPSAGDWAMLRQSRPDALEAIVEADEHLGAVERTRCAGWARVVR